MEIVYRAKDGTIFETESRCREHESQVEVELFFNGGKIFTTPGFRTAIIHFKDYVKAVLETLDTTIEEAPTEKPTPAFVPVLEEYFKERGREVAKSVLEEYFEEWNVGDIEDLEEFFEEHKRILATYFGFKL